MKAFLQVMQNRDNLEKKIAEYEGRDPIVGYHGIFSSHPDTEKRIAKVMSEEKFMKVSKKSKNKEKSASVQKIDRSIDVCRCLTEPGNSKYMQENGDACRDAISKEIGVDNWEKVNFSKIQFIHILSYKVI